MFPAIGRTLSNAYFLGLVAIALGVTAGLLVFVYVFPGQPRVGIIDVPPTVISNDSAFVITKLLHYARDDDSIKAVVIKLDTQGGGAASSERLYRETASLRAKKPVVILMNGVVASGGYLMSMGASHTFAQTSSIVGNVGTAATDYPSISPSPGEDVLPSGRYKIDGASRDEWIAQVAEITDSFAHIVMSERGDKLLLSQDELTQGRIYIGLRAVSLGLVDELGSDSDAIAKAAELAGVANYDLVDVNLEVLKEFAESVRDLVPANGDGGESAVAALTLMALTNAGGDLGIEELGGLEGSPEQVEALRHLLLYGQMGIAPENSLQDLPMEINTPAIYHLYFGHDQ